MPIPRPEGLPVPARSARNPDPVVRDARRKRRDRRASCAVEHDPELGEPRRIQGRPGRVGRLGHDRPNSRAALPMPTEWRLPRRPRPPRAGVEGREHPAPRARIPAISGHRPGSRLRLDPIPIGQAQDQYPRCRRGRPGPPASDSDRPVHLAVVGLARSVDQGQPRAPGSAGSADRPGCSGRRPRSPAGGCGCRAGCWPRRSLPGYRRRPGPGGWRTCWPAMLDVSIGRLGELGELSAASAPLMATTSASSAEP